MSHQSIELHRNFSTPSNRVKSVEFHSELPWILSALYDGTVTIFNFETKQLVKTIQVSEKPQRCAKFITRKNWFVCGGDDLQIRVFDLNTMELIKEFEGHKDFIRSFDVHPSLPYILSCGDDYKAKVWNWEQDFEQVKSFEEHSHYVMMAKFNPHNPNTAVSCSLDKTIKVWDIEGDSASACITLEGHERGVNCIDFFEGTTNYLVSGSDDNTMKIWDLENKSEIGAMEGHSDNIGTVMVLPDSHIVSGSEDGTVRVWDSKTFELETTMTAGGRPWFVASAPNEYRTIAVGSDDGMEVVDLCTIPQKQGNL